MTRKPWWIAGMLAVISLSTAPARSEVFPGSQWQTRSPEQAGLRADMLQQLADYAGGDGIVIRDGYQVYSWGDPSNRGDWASASKPVLTTLLFLAADQGLCQIDQTIGDFMVGGTAKDRAITFHHLASMTSGYSRGEGPGQAWAYNDFAINLYGYVLCEKVWGASPPDVVQDQLAFLGFQDPVTIGTGQYGRVKAMSVRDFARLGLFWLNRGQWDGEQVIPESYFDLIAEPVPSGTPVTSSDGPESWDLGSFGGSDNQTSAGPGRYAMNFWVNVNNNQWPGRPTNVYHAAGHGGQKVCWIVPDMNVVVAGIGGGALGNAAALDLILEANDSSPVTPVSWAEVKAMHR
ncbi:MAG: serine hydrolase [Gemmatimonadetes bacterium]|nr:serine hydrolase [Gemmatimonadota bacterium]